MSSRPRGSSCATSAPTGPTRSTTSSPPCRGTSAGRPIVGGSRGGASDASHFAATIPLTVDGLGPRGGGAHAPHEYVLTESLRPRAEVALAVADAVLRG